MSADKPLAIKINSPLKLDYYKGNIVAVYQYNGKTFRYNLFKTAKENFSVKTKTLKVNDDLYDCNAEVERIQVLATNVNRAIIELMKDKSKVETLKKKEIDACIIQLKLEKNKVRTTPKGFIADFEKWIEEYKEKKYQAEIMKGKEGRKNHPSAKDYVSAKNMLSDFEYDNYDSPLQLKDFTPSLLVAIIEYCYDERVDTKEHKYKTEGDLENKTIQKRMDSIFTFINDYYKTLPNDIKKPKLETIQKKIIRLDREELRLLEELEITNIRLQRIRDYFLFLCFTGLRYSDFSKIDATYHDKEANELILTTNKTSTNCRVFLFDKAKVIGEKYNFTFNHYTNQALNRGIRDLLTEYDLYKEPITIEFMQQGRKTTEDLKRNFITCHTARRTFISIMIENGLDVYDLMGMTGHTKVETLRYYIDLFGRKRKDKLIEINNKLK